MSETVDQLIRRLNSSVIRYRIFDERVGIWTSIALEERQIVIRLKLTHAFPWLLFAGFCSLVGGAWCIAIMQNSQDARAAIAVILIAAVAVTLSFGGASTAIRAFQSQRVIRGNWILSYSEGLLAPVAKIVVVVVRENYGRYPDDSARVQIYLIDDNLGSHLIHQRYVIADALAKEIELGSEVARHVGVPLVLDRCGHLKKVSQ